MTDYNTLYNLLMPYLQAIQRIPGNTASEKLRWIGKLASNEPDAIENLALFSPELLSLLQVEVAVKHKRYKDITSALMSDDSTIVSRAFRAFWFFDGNHKIVDVAYFCERIFPFVSLRTRVCIVKTLARRVKNPVFAREIFTAVATTYGIKNALPLIVACDENFIHQLVMRKIMLPGGILKKIFDKNLNLGIKFLKSFILDCKQYVIRNTLVNIKCQLGTIRYYKPLFIKLAKKCPMEFVNIVNSLNQCPEINVLSNKSADQFLRTALYAVAQRPHLYMPILPSKAITEKRIEVIFPSLMNQNRDFCVDKLLSYLKNYPEGKRLALLLETYRNIYQCELLHNMQNVTPTLLQLLPTKKRIAITRRLMNIAPSHCTMDYKTAWLCYFPVTRVRCLIAFKMRHASSWESRLAYMLQLIYNCKVNKDEDALYNTLKSLRAEKYVKCDDEEIYKKIVHYVSQVCEIPHLSERNGNLVFKIIRSFYKKYGYVEPSILEDLVRFRLNYNRPIVDLIEMLLVTNDNYKSINFNMLTDNPQYERTCFINFLNILYEYCIILDEVQEKQEEEEENQVEEHLEEEEIPKKNKEWTEQFELYRFIIAMYDFNDRCKNLRSKIKRLTITNYPWMMDTCYMIMNTYTDIPFFKEARNVLRKHEPDVYCCWFLSKISNPKIETVTLNNKICLLKENFKSVLDNWKKYLIDCERNFFLKHVQHFVRAIRWYKDIPIKFAERCISDLCGKDVTKMSSALLFLSILLHGNTTVKLINLLLFTKTERNTDCLDVTNDNFDAFKDALNSSMKLSNSPVPLSYIGELFQGAYSSKALLTTLANVSERSSMSEIMSFAENVRIFPANVQKLWIKMMINLASTRYLIDFLHKMWTMDDDCAVRELLYDAILRLFRERPGPDTLSLCHKVNMTLTLEDNVLLEKMNLRLD